MHRAQLFLPLVFVFGASNVAAAPASVKWRARGVCARLGSDNTARRTSPGVTMAGLLVSLDITGTRVLAVDGSTGKIVRKPKLASEGRSVDAAIDGLAIVRFKAGSLAAIDLQTGKPRWSRTVQPEAVEVVRIEGDLALLENLGKGPTVERIDARTGVSRWKIAVAAPSDLKSLIAAGTRLYGVGESGVVSIEPKDGSIAWTAKERVASHRKLATLGEHLAIASDRQIRIFDGATGKPSLVGTNATLSAVDGSKDTLVALIGKSLTLVAIDAPTRKERWTQSFKDEVRLVGVREDAIVVHDPLTGAVHAFDPKDGKTLWTYGITDEQLAVHPAMPAVTACHANTLVALDPSAKPEPETSHVVYGHIRCKKCEGRPYRVTVGGVSAAVDASSNYSVTVTGRGTLRVQMLDARSEIAGEKWIVLDKPRVRVRSFEPDEAGNSARDTVSAQ